MGHRCLTSLDAYAHPALCIIMSACSSPQTQWLSPSPRVSSSTSINDTASSSKSASSPVLKSSTAPDRPSAVSSPAQTKDATPSSNDVLSSHPTALPKTHTEYFNTALFPIRQQQAIAKSALEHALSAFNATISEEHEVFNQAHRRDARAVEIEDHVGGMGDGGQ